MNQYLRMCVDVRRCCRAGRQRRSLSSSLASTRGLGGHVRGIQNLAQRDAPARKQGEEGERDLLRVYCTVYDTVCASVRKRGRDCSSDLDRNQRDTILRAVPPPLFRRARRSERVQGDGRRGTEVAIIPREIPSHSACTTRPRTYYCLRQAHALASPALLLSSPSLPLDVAGMVTLWLFPRQGFRRVERKESLYYSAVTPALSPAAWRRISSHRKAALF